MIEWEPPSHQKVNEICMKTWVFDGGRDFVDSFALSGEPMSAQVGGQYGTTLIEQYNAVEIAKVNVEQRTIKKQYSDYWNSTASKTSTGRPIDAIISPIAPFPAARPKMYGYYGYTTWVNLLDYTSVVVPVTTVNKSVDLADKEYSPLNEENKICHESCKSNLDLHFAFLMLEADLYR